MHLTVLRAAHAFSEMITSNELSVRSFQDYGSDLMKKMGYSPDAFVQMAIQLATYRLFGRQCATYESTQVRPFLHGRTGKTILILLFLIRTHNHNIHFLTMILSLFLGRKIETTRSISPASAKFVKRMGTRPMNDELDQSSAKEEKRLLLTKAVDSHVDYIRSAAQGMGVDRHLFGLSMVVEEGEDAPSLFAHPLYINSKTWRVSTSTLPNNPGFGPVAEDGVAVAYDVKPNSCFFTITCRREQQYSKALSRQLELALLEMKALHEEDHLQSKL